MDDIINHHLPPVRRALEGHRPPDDPRDRLSTAEVMTVPLVVCTFCFGNLEASRSFLDEYGYMLKAISKSRFNRRLHAIDRCLWRTLFELLAEVFKHERSEQTYMVGSLPVAVYDNIRIGRCKLYPPEEHGEAFRGYTLQANAATSTDCGCTWCGRRQGRAGGVLTSDCFGS